MNVCVKTHTNVIPFGVPDFYLTIYCTYILIEHLCSEVSLAYLWDTWVSTCDHDFGHDYGLGHPAVYELTFFKCIC